MDENIELIVFLTSLFNTEYLNTSVTLFLQIVLYAPLP